MVKEECKKHKKKCGYVTNGEWRQQTKKDNGKETKVNEEQENQVKVRRKLMEYEPPMEHE